MSKTISIKGGRATGLRLGDVFTCAKFSELRYVVMDHEPDRTRLETGGRYVHVQWTERGEDGWVRQHRERLDIRVDDADTIGEKRFLVTEARLKGGCQIEGFPDGWHVTAKEVDGDRTVRFYQSGCFIGKIESHEVTLVAEGANR